MASTSPFRTEVDLVMAVLAKLNVLSTGQTVAPEDFESVQIEVDSILRKIAGLELVSVPDVNHIPGALFNDITDIVTGECASKFFSNDQTLSMLITRGLGGPPSPTPVGGGAAAQSLKIITRGRPTYERMRAEYF